MKYLYLLIVGLSFLGAVGWCVLDLARPAPEDWADEARRYLPCWSLAGSFLTSTLLYAGWRAWRC